MDVKLHYNFFLQNNKKEILKNIWKKKQKKLKQN